MFQQAQGHEAALRSLFQGLATLWWRTISWYMTRPSQHSSMLFSRALWLSSTTSPCPSERPVGHHEASFQPTLFWAERTKGPLLLQVLCPLFAALLWMLSNSFMPFLYVPKSARSVQGEATSAQSRAGQSLPLPAWQCCVLCISGYGWHSCLLEHTVDSHSTCCQLNPLNPFQQDCFSSTSLLGLCASPGSLLPKCRIWHLLLFSFPWLVVAQLSSLVHSARSLHPW